MSERLPYMNSCAAPELAVEPARSAPLRAVEPARWTLAHSPPGSARSVGSRPAALGQAEARRGRCAQSSGAGPRLVSGTGRALGRVSGPDIGRYGQPRVGIPAVAPVTGTGWPVSGDARRALPARSGSGALGGRGRGSSH